MTPIAIVDRIVVIVLVVSLGAWLRVVSLQIAEIDERLRSRDACIAEVRREYDDRAARAEAHLAEARAKIRAVEEEAAKP